MLRNKLALFAITFVLALGFFVLGADAATLSLRPSQTKLEVGEIVDVSILLDTQGAAVNAVQILLKFSPEKLQVISPSTGQSIIGVWAAQPSFNNRTGEIRLEGGIPGGTNIANGLITTIRFRAKGSGSAPIQIDPTSRVLANDGLGSDVLVSTPGAFLTVELPKSSGPLITSPTHPSQTHWYGDTTLVLSWEEPSGGVTGYSYVLDDRPTTVPDTVSEGTDEEITYERLQSGTHYFHIRTLANGSWGGVSHYSVQIDSEKPAAFKPRVIPRIWTSSHQPVLEFLTTDTHSGIDHYEIKLIQLSKAANAAEVNAQELFIEAASPYVSPYLEPGKYEYILRAYDRAQNYYEVTQQIRIVAPIFGIVVIDGIQLTDTVWIPWAWIWFFALSVLIFFAILSRRLHHRSKRLGAHPFDPTKLPEPVKSQLAELHSYQKRYGKLAALLLIIILSGFGFAATPGASAQTAEMVPTPVISQLSKDLTTDDTFYVGGTVVSPETEVIIYWENLTTGEARSVTVVADERGEWFYHHSSTLAEGNYRIWAQSRVGATTSPPSPQIDTTVRSAELRIGPAHIRYEVAYLIVIVALTGILILIGVLIFLHWHKIRRHHARFMEEVRKGEESIRRGFAVLRHDLELEFAGIQKEKKGRALTRDEIKREEQLTRDIEAIQKKIGEEVWQLEKLEEKE